MTIKQLKQIVLLTAALLPILVVAQNQTSTPYSFYGIGDTYDPGNIRTLGMGGTALAVRSNIYVNTSNPASYMGIDSLSFVASMGVQSTMGSYRTNEQTSNLNNTTINHIIFGFPVTRWWKSSLAVLPFSNVGYEVQQDEVLDFNVFSRTTYSGSGGLDKVNWGNAFRITKNLSVGINSSYYFGRVEHLNTLIFPDSAYIVNAKLSERDLLHGFEFTVGAQYFIPTGDKSFLGFAATYTPTATLKVKTDYLATTFIGDEVGYETVTDTVYIKNGLQGETTLPYTYGFGISWENKDKLLLAADILFDNWKSFSYLGQSDNLSNKLKVSFGAEFIPTSNNLSSYLKLVRYRFGVRFNKMGLNFNNTDIEEYALSVGFGLPLRKSASIINLGIEIGQNGTIQNSLIQERFFKVALGISIKENWFRKGKYF